MMQTADLRDCDHLAAVWWLEFAFNRRVAIQCQVGSRFMVIVEVISKDSPEMAFVDCDDILKALSTYTADDSLDVWILAG